MGIVRGATEQSVHVFVCACIKIRVYVAGWVWVFVFVFVSMTSLVQVGNIPLFNQLNRGHLETIVVNGACYVRNVSTAFLLPIHQACCGVSGQFDQLAVMVEVHE